MGINIPIMNMQTTIRIMQNVSDNSSRIAMQQNRRNNECRRCGRDNVTLDSNGICNDCNRKRESHVMDKREETAGGETVSDICRRINK